MCHGFPASWELSQASICGLRNLAGGHPLRACIRACHPRAPSPCVGGKMGPAGCGDPDEWKPATKEACLVVPCVVCHLIYCLEQTRICQCISLPRQHNQVA
mgnify:CR=1 FL=1